jgi:hypothetical protein
MRTLQVTGLALAIAAGFALPLAGSAQAAMGGVLPSTQVLPVERAQFFFLGHNFCWYDDGWQGPGWYWCNYAWNSGYGWGGGDGWRGWNRNAYHGRRSMPRPPDRDHGVRPPVVHAPLVQPTHPSKITGGFAPHNNVVHTPQMKAGAFNRGAASHGAAPNRVMPNGGGPGAHSCGPGGKC